MKRILTLQQLAEYFEKNKLYTFNSDETGTQLVVQIPAHFSNEETSESDGFLHVRLRTCHTDKNRNGSYISESNMKKAMPTLKYRPVLAAIHKTDSGELEFHGHDMEIDNDGNTRYIERQVGSFTADEPYLEYDEDYGKTYVVANAVIPLEYTEAAEIIRRHGGTKVSVELVIDTLSYNAKEKYLELIDFRFGACTLLGYEKDGTEIREGMIGSRLDIEDFSIRKDSYEKDRTECIEVLENPDGRFSNLNIKQDFQKGGNPMSKLDELTSLYEVNPEDITFETDGLTDNELEQAFASAFGQTSPASDHTQTESSKRTCRIIADGREYTHEFELSMNEKIGALEALVNDTYAENDHAYYSVYVYEKYVVMRDYWTGCAYRQEYKLCHDTYTLTGDRIDVFANYLTKDEEAELDKMRSSYAELTSFREQAERKELRAKKMTVLDAPKYECLKDIEAFRELRAGIDNYTLDEVTVQAKVIFADNADHFDFGQAAKSHVGIGYGETKEAKPYGDLFD